MMNTVEQLEHEVAQLPPKDLRRFRAWFQAFDAAQWDAELLEAVDGGALDALADEALKEHEQSQTKPL